MITHMRDGLLNRNIFIQSIQYHLKDLILVTGILVFLYSIILLFYPQFLNNNSLISLRLNQFLIISIDGLLACISVIIWVNIREYNKERKKISNIGMNLFIIGLFIFNFLTLELVFPKLFIWNYISESGLGIIGLILLFLGVSLELTRLDENIHYILKDSFLLSVRLFVSLFLSLFMFSIDIKPIIFLFILFIVWFDLFSKKLFNLMSIAIVKIFRRMKGYIRIVGKKLTCFYLFLKNSSKTFILVLNYHLKVAKLHFLSIARCILSAFTAGVIFSSLLYIFFRNSEILISTINFGLEYYLLIIIINILIKLIRLSQIKEISFIRTEPHSYKLNKQVLYLIFFFIFFSTLIISNIWLKFHYISYVSITISGIFVLCLINLRITVILLTKFVNGSSAVILSLCFTVIFIGNILINFMHQTIIFLMKNSNKVIKIVYTFVGTLLLVLSFFISNFYPHLGFLSSVIAGIGIILLFITWRIYIEKIYKTLYYHFNSAIAHIYKNLSILFLIIIIKAKKFYEFVIQFFITNKRKILHFLISLTAFILILLGLDQIFYHHSSIMGSLLFILGLAFLYDIWSKQITTIFYKIIFSTKKLIVYMEQNLMNIYKRFIHGFITKLALLLFLVNKYSAQILKTALTLVSFLFVSIGILEIAFLKDGLIGAILVLLSIGMFSFTWKKELIYRISKVISSTIIFLKILSIKSIEMIEFLKAKTKNVLKITFNWLIINSINILKAIGTVLSVGLFIIANKFIFDPAYGLFGIIALFLDIILFYSIWKSEIDKISVKGFRIMLFSLHSIILLLTLFFFNIYSIIELFFNQLKKISFSIYKFVVINRYSIIKCILSVVSFLMTIIGIDGFSKGNNLQIFFFLGLLLFYSIWFNYINHVVVIGVSMAYTSIQKCLDIVNQLMDSLFEFIGYIIDRIKFVFYVLAYYTINWFLIWVSLIFGLFLLSYGVILIISGIIDNTGTWTIFLLGNNLLFIFKGINPVILILLALGFVIAGILLLRVIAERREDFVFKFTLYPQNKFKEVTNNE